MVRNILKSKSDKDKNRIIQGFLKITNFTKTNGHPPRFKSGSSVSEKMLAIDLKALKSCEWTHELLKNHDPYKILDMN